MEVSAMNRTLFIPNFLGKPLGVFTDESVAREKLLEVMKAYQPDLEIRDQGRGFYYSNSRIGDDCPGIIFEHKPNDLTEVKRWLLMIKHNNL